MATGTNQDDTFLDLAIDQATKSCNEAGVPTGAVLVNNAAGEVLGLEHNKRVQHGDAIAHGENATTLKRVVATTSITVFMILVLAAPASADSTPQTDEPDPSSPKMYVDPGYGPFKTLAN